MLEYIWCRWRCRLISGWSDLEEKGPWATYCWHKEAHQAWWQQPGQGLGEEPASQARLGLRGDKSLLIAVLRGIVCFCALNEFFMVPETLPGEAWQSLLGVWLPGSLRNGHTGNLLIHWDTMSNWDQGIALQLLKVRCWGSGCIPTGIPSQPCC